MGPITGSGALILLRGMISTEGAAVVGRKMKASERWRASSEAFEAMSSSRATERSGCKAMRVLSRRSTGEWPIHEALRMLLTPTRPATAPELAR